MNATNPVGDLIALAERLSSLLAEESALLMATQTHEIAALQADKVKLARAFELQVAAFDRDAGLLGQLEPGLKTTLRNAMGRVREAIAENARRLRAAREVNQRLIKIIVRAVSDQNRKLDLYTASGNLSASVYSAHPVRKTVSISVNQQL